MKLHRGITRTHRGAQSHEWTNRRDERTNSFGLRSHCGNRCDCGSKSWQEADNRCRGETCERAWEALEKNTPLRGNAFLFASLLSEDFEDGWGKLLSGHFVGTSVNVLPISLITYNLHSVSASPQGASVCRYRRAIPLGSSGATPGRALRSCDSPNARGRRHPLLRAVVRTPHVRGLRPVPIA